VLEVGLKKGKFCANAVILTRTGKCSRISTCTNT
jgi:hypothetical protein